MNNIKRYLQENESTFIQQLIEYLRFPSVSAQPHHRADVLACATWLVQHCQEIGLAAKLYPTKGHPIVVAKTPRRPGRRHFLLYGHYDVQPAEPFELWHSPPFEPRREGTSLYARGASDNKGQHFAHLKAVEAYFKTGTELPCDITFLIEGEEEVGSRNLTAFLQQHGAELKCDAVIISDNPMPALEYPALTYALRGLVAMEIRVSPGNKREKSETGVLEALCGILASFHDENGRVRVRDFYTDVVRPSVYERRQLARLPFDRGSYLKLVGAPRLFGERGFSPREQITSRPTVEINGLTGVRGTESLPSLASAKLSIRLVPNQNPDEIRRRVIEHLRRICPPDVHLEIKNDHDCPPYIVSPRSAYAQGAMRALKKAFERPPVLQRDGGSIPIVTEFKKVLQADTLLLGLGFPDDNAHSPNEKFDLRAFAGGMWLGANLWPELVRCEPDISAKRRGARRGAAIEASC